MFPIVAVERSKAARVDCEMTHEEGWCSIILTDQPLYLHALRAFLGDGGIWCFVQAGFVQERSQCKKRKRQDKPNAAY